MWKLWPKTGPQTRVSLRKLHARALWDPTDWIWVSTPMYQVPLSTEHLTIAKKTHSHFPTYSHLLRYQECLWCGILKVCFTALCYTISRALGKSILEDSVTVFLQKHVHGPSTYSFEFEVIYPKDSDFLCFSLTAWKVRGNHVTFHLCNKLKTSFICL